MMDNDKLIALAKECGAVQWKPSKVWLTCFNSVDKLRAFAEAVQPKGWHLIADAPMWVNGRDALVGQFSPAYGWKKVTIWESEWTRDNCIARGATHWWPHLRDLPLPPKE